MIEPGEPGYAVPVDQSLSRLDKYLADHPALQIRIACPSQEFPAIEMSRGTGRWFSGVRGIWESLSLVFEPDVALMMVQAPPVPDEVVDYLFGTVARARKALATPSAMLADLTGRHAMINIEDGRECHLSDKLLGKPAVMEQMRAIISKARRRGQVVQGLSGYASSERMAGLADALGVDLLETPPDTLAWGTKAGSRQIFRDAAVAHAPGTYKAERDITLLAEEIVRLGRAHPGEAWMVKLNEGLGSGHGNAILHSTSDRLDEVASALRFDLQPECPDMSRDEFLSLLDQVGAIVEQYLRPAVGGEVRFPSAIGHISVQPDGSTRCAVLGTHEQIIGPHGEFIGCSFPARSSYRDDVLRGTRLIMADVASRGVCGHLGIDFIAHSVADGHAGFAIAATEINLRQTGSTHPHMTVRAVVDGEWLEDGRLVDRTGREVVYSSTDALVSERYRGISARRLIAAMRTDGRLCYDPALGGGVVPHLWTTLEPFGKVGATVIGHSIEECAARECAFISLLDQVAEDAAGGCVG